MADQHVVERSDSGIGTGMVLGIVVVLLIAVIAIFFLVGGPTRFAGGAPSQTNVNVPAQQPPQSAPNVQVPRQIDVNVNQPPVQQAPAQQAPAAPAQQAPAAPAQQAPVAPVAPVPPPAAGS